jgi:molybdopterin-containing oxidoreductase family iron-sulfur binding subunit
MVLSLYDSKRLRKPLCEGSGVEWKRADETIKDELKGISEGVYILTGTVASETTKAVIEKFLSRFKNSAHVEYDPVSYSGILDAHEEVFEKRVVPRFRFERAEVLVSFDADFLGTWISPVEFTKGYVGARRADGDLTRFSKHVQFEGRVSLTGSNADRRIRATPGECRAALKRIAGELAKKSGHAAAEWAQLEMETSIGENVIAEVADELWRAKGKSLVLCGLNDVESQLTAIFINQILGNYGNTLDINEPSHQWKGNDGAVAELVRKMQLGGVKALFIADVNPVYSLPNCLGFKDGLKKIPLTVTFAEHLNETAELTRWACPLHHFLESWNDAEIVSGVINVSQPVIRALGDTRSLREALMAWSETPQADLEIIRSVWREKVFPRQTKAASFEKFWDRAVQDGYAAVDPRPMLAIPPKASRDRPRNEVSAETPDKYTLVLYEKISMRDGRHAQNPWLQELPDPVTKAVWDNYVCLSPGLAKGLKIEEGELVEVSSGNISVELTAQVQPGQHDKVVAIALGYGRKGTDRFSRVGPEWLQGEATVKEGQTVGKSSFVFVQATSRGLLFENSVSVAPTGKRSTLAVTQMHHSITVPEHLGGQRRNIIRETTIEAFHKDPASGNRFEEELLDLWPDDHKHKGHHWGMAIDLNRCTGCSACIVSCQAENNIPVVGKDEVHRHREMHWIRIDRYYSGNNDEVDIMHQPVMCQHCDHAPCESVCPVLATVHSDEGLNQQVYNRCVGTRYCLNNCPYKVRRFNWFNYRQEDQLENLVLNPDVTTRSRGVMEKCSLCVQRIQEAKAEALRKGMPLADRDIQTACQQSCPADAIVFGDLNDPESQVSKLAKSPRHYHMLEEMNFKPAVGYLTKIRNRKDPG